LKAFKFSAADLQPEEQFGLKCGMRIPPNGVGVKPCIVTVGTVINGPPEARWCSVENLGAAQAVLGDKVLVSGHASSDTT